MPIKTKTFQTLGFVPSAPKGMVIYMRKIVSMAIFIGLFLSTKVYALDLSAECAYLMTADSGVCLYEKNGEVRHNIASTTKIMTAITAIENGCLDDMVRVSANAAAQEGSSVYLRTGNKVLLKDLLYGMLLNSGNDAACAVAEYAGGSVEGFAKMMNRKAKEIGANNTCFINPSGLDADGHYSTARDMALISAYALKNDIFSEIVSTKTAQINVGEDICYLKNHNKLLWNYDGCIGVKTGYTKKTGRCLVSAAERGGITLIAVTLGAPDDWNDHKKMLDYGFENTELILPVKKGDVLKSYSQRSIVLNAVVKDDIQISAKKNSGMKFDVVVHAVGKASEEIMTGEKIGYAECFLGEDKLCEVDLIADIVTNQEEKKIGLIEGFIQRIKKILLKI